MTFLQILIVVLSLPVGFLAAFLTVIPFNWLCCLADPKSVLGQLLAWAGLAVGITTFVWVPLTIAQWAMGGAQ